MMDEANILDIIDKFMKENQELKKRLEKIEKENTNSRINKV